MFREQVSTVSNWFDRWSPCEQTVAMVALLRRLHPTQARFVATILHRQLNECSELRRTEILSNDPNFVASLANTESKETLMRDLLAYLPLLHAKNVDVKNVYLALITKVLKYVMDHFTMIDDARQLLSYSLIHPAFSGDDRNLFSNLLHQFEEKVGIMNSMNNRDRVGGGGGGGDNDHSSSGHYTSSLSGSPPSLNDFGNSWQQNNSPPNNNGGSLSPASQSVLSVSNFVGSSNLSRIRRSNSLTPPVMHSDAWNAVDELCGGPKPRSLSLSSEISPQGSLASSGSGSESHLDDPRPTFTAPGMKDIPCWLKSLRLHKYAFLFAYITFDEMMGLNEQLLEKQGVTKGARHKICLSISKLRERPGHLKQLYDSMTDDKESVRNALTEIKWMLTTPIKPCAREDAATTTTTTGENTGCSSSSGGNNNNNSTCNSNPNPPGPIGSNRFQQSSVLPAEETLAPPAPPNNNETLSAQPWNGDDELPEKIMNVIRKACEMNPDSECEGLLISILDKCLSHDAFTAKQKRLLSLWRQQQAPMMRRNSNGHPHFHHRTSSSPGSNNGKQNRHFNPRVLNLPSGIGTGSWTNAGNSIHAMFMAKRPSLQDSILESVRSCSHLSVQRTKSAPLPNFFASLSSSPPMFDTLGSLGNQTPADILAGLNFVNDIGGLSSGDNNHNNTTNSSSSGQQTSAMDITSRLESLCLSMTEACLGPAFNSY